MPLFVDCGNMVKGGYYMEPFIYQQHELPFFVLKCWQERFPHLEVGISAKIPEKDWKMSNYAFHVGDDAARVRQNRQALAKQLQIPFAGWTCAEQVHGTHIHLVKAVDRGKGSEDQQSAIPETDGLLTFETDLYLTSFYADCVPLYFYSPDQDLIGVAHAGWKGTVNGMARKMVERMVQLGAKREKIHVAIGPSIGICCYEVDQTVMGPLMRELKPASVSKNVYEIVDQPNQYRVDLKQANAEILLQAGIPAQQIVQSKLCTSCQTDYFHSHRRDQGDTGRMVAWIGKRGGA